MMKDQFVSKTNIYIRTHTLNNGVSNYKKAKIHRTEENSTQQHENSTRFQYPLSTIGRTSRQKISQK